MKALKVIVAIVVILITTPIWYYLLHEILEAVHASDLMWFLYWVYVPFGIIMTILNKVVEINDND